MSWANSVLPVFMAASRQIPGRLPELAITIQIDTTLCSLEILVSHGFQRFNPSFNRTVVVSRYLVALVGILMLVAAIHFVYANRFTEPMLAAIPVEAGAWAFLTLVYLPFSVGWANFTTDRMGYFASVIESIGSFKVQSIQALMMAPLLVMYLLAKKSYIRLIVLSRSLRPNPSFHRTLR